MGLLTRTHPAIERRFTLRNPTDFFLDWFNGGTESLSGERVTPTTSLGLSAYFAAIRAISEDVAKLPFHVYQTVGRSRHRLRDHPIDELFNCSANEFTSSMAFRETNVSHALGWGNGYAEIVRDRGGRPVELITLDPTTVTPEFNDARRLVYRVRRTDTRSERTLPAADMFHLHGLGFDGLVGYSVASMARESLGVGLAAQAFAGAFFGNGAHFSGIVKTPKLKDETARQNFMESLQKKAGVRKAGRLFHVEGEGVEFIPMSIPAKDAQFIETVKHAVREVSRWFRIPPHKIGDLEDASFSNITEQSIEYVVDALCSWTKRVELEVKRKLITPAERAAGVFAKHIVEGLLRGDMGSRYAAYAVGRQWGWESPNTVLELEDRDPLPGDQGDIFLVPGNMISADQVGREPAPSPPSALPAPDDGDANKGDGDANKGDGDSRSVDGVIRSFGPTLTATFDRLMRASAEKMQRNEKREDFDAWMTEFTKAHLQHVAETLEPTVRSMLSAIWSVHRGGELPTAISLTVEPLSQQVARRILYTTDPAKVADDVVEMMIQTARTLGE